MGTQLRPRSVPQSRSLTPGDQRERIAKLLDPLKIRYVTGCRCRAAPCSKVKFPPLFLSPLAVGFGNDLVHLVGIVPPEPEGDIVNASRSEGRTARDDRRRSRPRRGRGQDPQALRRRIQGLFLLRGAILLPPGRMPTMGLDDDPPKGPEAPSPRSRHLLPTARCRAWSSRPPGALPGRPRHGFEAQASAFPFKLAASPFQVLRLRFRSPRPTEAESRPGCGGIP